MPKSFSEFCVFASVLAALTGFCIFFDVVPASAADDLLVLEENDSAAVSGTITAIGNESLTLLSNGKEITVDTRDMDLEGDLEDLLSVGTNVMVEGAYDNDRLDAQRIVRTEARADSIKDASTTDVILLDRPRRQDND